MTNQPLSNQDTIMLRVEEAVNPNVSTGVMVLKTPIDAERLRQTLKARMLIFGRFRQRVIQPKAPWRRIHWADDPDFDLDYHMRQVRLPPPGDRAALQALVSELVGTPLDLDRPLWQMHHIERYGQGCALVCRVHHALADGVSLMHVLISLADTDPSIPPDGLSPAQRARPRGAAPQGSTSRGRQSRWGLGTLAYTRRGLGPARHVRDVAQAAYEMLFSAPDSGTGLRGSSGAVKQAAWSAAIPLDEIKRIGQVMDGTFNDILLTAVAGALGRYLRARGEKLNKVRLRALIPVNLRPRGSEGMLGNGIGIVLLPLPIAVSHPLERFEQVHSGMDDLKHSLQAPLIYLLMKVFGRLPRWVIDPLLKYVLSRATVVVTHIKGPRKPQYVVGAPLGTVMFWIPRFGGLGVGLSLLSYAGQVRVGIISDLSRRAKRDAEPGSRRGMPATGEAAYTSSSADRWVRATRARTVM
jgi:WS/DGAT/MGAT family acyltransferase